jgi:hypothetical protein
MANPQRIAPEDRAEASRGSTDLVSAPSGAKDLGSPSTGTHSNRSQKSVVPLRERCWISVREAHQIAGEGRTIFYAHLKADLIVTRKIGRRRLVSVPSLLEYCGERVGSPASRQTLRGDLQ